MRVHTFNVIPSLPPRLQPLLEMAYNLAFSWHPEARRLFRRMDPKLWVETNHNPVALLSRLDQSRIDELLEDPVFLEQVDRVHRRMEADSTGRTWFQGGHAKTDPDLLVAYFCAEFGLTEALPIYSGGLGVLAGDHLKSASAIGLPLVGIGLVYTQGYFRQYLNADGWQQEAPYDNDFAMLPIKRARTPKGELASVVVDIEGRHVEVQLWEARVARTRLYLLDTNSPANDPRDQAITSQLYGGGTELRFKQEIVLGIGGIRALEALGIEPTVYHMNEGHSAFLALERVRRTIQDTGMGFGEARELCAASNVFTTHTPVPAGFDIFTVEQLDRYLPRIHEDLGIERRELLALGAHEDDPHFRRGFNMAYLALRCASRINAVSQLHAEVSRRMWQRLWPGHEAREVPIVGITNGIHTRTWLSEEMANLLDHYVGSEWAADTSNEKVWRAVWEAVPDAELWRAHERGRERMVSYLREKVAETLEKKGAPPDELAQASELLDPHALTIGFARRFATYKRATLLLREPERLRRLLTDEARPVQFVFAGKAHPQDQPGKQLIKDLVHFSRDPAVRRRIVFLEEYDMGVARRLVQGVDVWLNNPRRPKEASGTSGMKVVPNGGLNLSVLDGWWDEAYDGTNGFAIGAGEEYADVERGDAIEADLLFDLLETALVPTFYDRGIDRIPRGWIRRMKASMAGLSARFSTDRMLKEYTDLLYLPAHRHAGELAAESHAGARALADRVRRLQASWGQVYVADVRVEGPTDLPIGESVQVDAAIHLGPVDAADVRVEIFAGRVDGHRQIVGGDVVEMTPAGVPEDGRLHFSGRWTPSAAGQSGVTVRVRPRFALQAPVRDIHPKAWGM